MPINRISTVYLRHDSKSNDCEYLRILVLSARDMGGHGLEDKPSVDTCSPKLVPCAF